MRHGVCCCSDIRAAMPKKKTKNDSLVPATLQHAWDLLGHAHLTQTVSNRMVFTCNLKRRTRSARLFLCTPSVNWRVFRAATERNERKIQAQQRTRTTLLSCSMAEETRTLIYIGFHFTANGNEVRKARLTDRHSSRYFNTHTHTQCIHSGVQIEQVVCCSTATSQKKK